MSNSVTLNTDPTYPNMLFSFFSILSPMSSIIASPASSCQTLDQAFIDGELLATA